MTDAMPHVNAGELNPILNLGHIDLARNLSYRFEYFRLMVMGLLRPHRPAFENPPPEIAASVSFNRRLQKNWLKFVGCEFEDFAPPLTYYSIAGAPGLLRLLSHLKINFSTLLHLKNELTIMDGHDQLPSGQVYHIRMKIADVVVKSRGRFILVIEGVVENDQGRCVRKQKDYWFVNRCPSRYLETLKTQPQFGRHDVSEFQGLSQRLPTWLQWKQDETQTYEHHLAADAGAEYGALSGDTNIIHTSQWGARLCGFPRAFLQGYGLTNIALSYLTRHAGSTLSEFQIIFVRPAFVKQTIRIHVAPGLFEICCEKGEVLAAGRWL